MIISSRIHINTVHHQLTAMPTSMPPHPLPATLPGTFFSSTKKKKKTLPEVIETNFEKKKKIEEIKLELLKNLNSIKQVVSMTSSQKRKRKISKFTHVVHHKLHIFVI